MKFIRPLCTLLFGVAVVLFFGLAYPHHLHYQEQFQLFLFDSNPTLLYVAWLLALAIPLLVYISCILGRRTFYILLCSQIHSRGQL